MPCVCGDTMCPSCGPAQGYTPACESVVYWSLDVVLSKIAPLFDRERLAEEIADKLGRRCSQELIAAIESEARKPR